MHLFPMQVQLEPTYADVEPSIPTTVKMPPTTDSNVQYSLLTHDQHKDPAGMITLDQYSDTTTLASLVTNTNLNHMIG